MALPSSGQISLVDIAGEFGGSIPYGLTDYLGSGGAPSSLPLAITDFYGLSAVPDVNIDSGEWTSSFFASQGWSNESLGIQTSADFHSDNRLRLGRTYDSGSKTVTYGFNTIRNELTSLAAGTYKLQANCSNPTASGINQSVFLNIFIEEVGGSRIESTFFEDPTGWKETQFTLSTATDVYLYYQSSSGSDVYGVDLNNIRLVAA